MHMIVDLGSVEGPEKEFSFEAAAGEVDLGEEAARLVGALSVSGVLTKEPKVEVRGVIKGELELDCTRCLSPIRKPLEIAFDDVFVPPAEMNSSEEKELTGSDFRTDVLSGERIDILEVAREQILLSLPTQVFCRDDCKGLCDRCGANLNSTECDCRKEDIDPRWAALKNLK